MQPCNLLTKKILRSWSQTIQMPTGSLLQRSPSICCQIAAQVFPLMMARSRSWRQFTGDQIGVMLGVWLFRQYKATGQPLGRCWPKLQ